MKLQTCLRKRCFVETRKAKTLAVFFSNLSLVYLALYNVINGPVIDSDRRESVSH